MPGVDHCPGGEGFLEALDEKLRLRNDRLRERLYAWAMILDTLGWCVACQPAGGALWLGEHARTELGRSEGDAPSWDELLDHVAGRSTDDVHLRSEGILLWSPPRQEMPQGVPHASLTRREHDVLLWLRQGKTGPEIAVILDCAVRTVEKHISNLYQKLGVKRRAELILRNVQSKEADAKVP